MVAFGGDCRDTLTSLRYEVELSANRLHQGAALEELDMVGAFTKFSCSRPSTRTRHHHFLEDRIGGNRISPAGLVHSVPSTERFEAVEHPSEPMDVDQPARCPPPELCITQDGLKWKEMVARRREKKTWQGDDTGMMIPQPRRRIHNSPRAKYLFMIPSVPEQQRVVTRLLE